MVGGIVELFRVGLRKAKHYPAIALRSNRSDLPKQLGHSRRKARIFRALEREDHVARGYRSSIVPASSRVELENQCGRIPPSPGAGQRRHEVAVARREQLWTELRQAQEELIDHIQVAYAIGRPFHQGRDRSSCLLSGEDDNTGAGARLGLGDGLGEGRHRQEGNEG
jgi:hypothetical protein